MTPARLAEIRERHARRAWMLTFKDEVRDDVMALLDALDVATRRAEQAEQRNEALRTEVDALTLRLAVAAREQRGVDGAVEVTP